jgi:hypothetical protein
MFPLPVPDTDKNGHWFPTSDVTNQPTHHCNAAFSTPEQTGQVHSDQIGRFPIALSTGNKYLLLVYAHSSNGIHCQAS